MALFDKVKSQAAQVAQKAQEAGRAGQARLEDAQARRQLDALYRDFGAAMYAQRAGRADQDTKAEIERLAAALQEFESSHGVASMTPSKTAPAEPSSAGETPPGDFKLD